MVRTITVFVEIATEITNFYLLGNWKLLGNLCSSQNTINSTQYDETNSERAFLKFLQLSRYISHRYHSRFFVRVGHETTYAAIGKHNFFTLPCHCQTYKDY